ncbi:MAG TPA: hypothetical protein VIL08_04795 [Limnochorda sp.]
MTAVLMLATAGLLGGAFGTAQESGPYTLEASEAYRLLENLIERRPLDQGEVQFQVEGRVSLVGLNAPFAATVEQQGRRAVVNVHQAPAFVPREIETFLSDARTYLADFDFAFTGVEFLNGEPQAVFQGTLKEGASGAQKGSVWISLETGELRRIALSYWWGSVDSTLEYGIELGRQVVRNQEIRVSPWGLTLTLRYHGFRWPDAP